MLLFIIVFAVLGLIGIISPKTSWYLSNWWRFQNDTEPSSTSLIFYRVFGVVLLSAAVFLTFRLVI